MNPRHKAWLFFGVILLVAGILSSLTYKSDRSSQDIGFDKTNMFEASNKETLDEDIVVAKDSQKTQEEASPYRVDPIKGLVKKDESDKESISYFQ